jgi:DNA-binding response OmpR family regulator
MSQQQSVLVVDDEADIIDLAAMYLESEGFRVLRASDGTEALDIVREEPPDLVILDIMLPGMDGWEVCRRLRATSTLPVIMLTARGDPIDRVVGLELGADDYMVKPFHGRELVARVRAVLRRSGAEVAAQDAPEPAVTVGDLRIDPARREVRVAGSAVDMRAREFDLLLHLARNEGLVQSRDQLLERVWGYDFLGDSRTVDVHIAHVRSRIAKSVGVRIDTVWGVGYKLVRLEDAASD